jgi:hypothetical protein
MVSHAGEKVSFVITRLSSGESVRGTVPFSCPFAATKIGNRQQGVTQSERRNRPIL